MKYGVNKVRWGVALAFLGAAFNASAVLISAESFQTSAATDDYTAELHVTATANSKIIVGNLGFNTLEPWVNTTGAITANGTPDITDHSAVTSFPGRNSDLGCLRVATQAAGVDRNSRRNLGTIPPLASTYFLSGLVRLGELAHLADGQDLSLGFMYTLAPNEYNVTNGMHFGVRRVAGVAYLTASAGGNTYNLFDLTGHYGEVYQIVLRLDVNAEGNDTLTAWYAANGSATLTLGLDSTSVETWAETHDLFKLVAQEKSTAGPALFGSRFDEVRLGTEWADVTTLPNPGLSGGYEAWMLAYAAGAGALTNQTDNPDGDALNNLYEWGLGGDPTNSADIGHVPTYGIVDASGTNVLEYVYAKRNNADILGLVYYLEQNTDLVMKSQWTNGNYSVTGSGVLDGDFIAVSNTIPANVEDVQFLRLIIEAN